ncbi:MAG: hypothetical protein JNK82_31490 [Myxococcaceae bacterium]|nr:hypothetical protein [Myxococcaceae bacterium]
MQRQIQVAGALLLLAAAGCKKEAAPTALPGAPYTLAASRDGEQQRVTVKTASGYHVNDEYPVSFQPEGGERLQLKDVVTKTACESGGGFSCTAVVAFPNVAGTLAFSVCSEEKCLIEKVAIKPTP